MARYWVNQPSTLQPYHKLNGQTVLADFATAERCKDGQTYVRVYFTHGPSISMEMSTLALSEGWPRHRTHPDDALVEALEDCEGVLDSVNRQLSGRSIAVLAVLEKARTALKRAREVQP